MEEKRSPEGTQGGHDRPVRAWQARNNTRALVSYAHQGHLPGSFLFS